MNKVRNFPGFVVFNLPLFGQSGGLLDEAALGR